MPPTLHSAGLTISRLLLLCSLLATPATGHTTVAVDPSDSPFLPKLGNAGNTAGPLLVHTLAMLRLRQENTSLDLTIADTAAYQLLKADPYTAPGNPSGTGNRPVGTPDPHFDQDRALLIERAATLFTLATNGAPLQPVAVSAELTSTQDIIFHLTYPVVPPGPLQLQARFIDQVPAGQIVLVEIMDSTHRVIAYTGLDASNPSLEAMVPSPTPAAPPAANPFTLGQFLRLAAGILAATGMFLLIRKLRREPGPADNSTEVD